MPPAPHNVRSILTGVGGYLPRRCVSNDELAARLDTSDAWIRERTGITQRYLADETETAACMGTEAARAALGMAGATAADVDGIIVGTSTPDQAFPATALRIQAALGVTRGFGFDIAAACSGFIYALSVADAMIRAGQARGVLVIGSEVYSRILDWEDRGTCVLFGDGAGAVVLQRSDAPGILSTHIHADGSHAHILSVPGTVCGGKVSGRPLLQMEGNAVFKFAVRVLEEVAHEALAANNLTTVDIDWLIPHQANIRIIQATAKKLGMPMDKVITTVDRHANTSAASIPLALDVAVRDGRIRAGHNVLLEGVGGGFTWGAVLARW